jgi:hypothetical protein
VHNTLISMLSEELSRRFVNPISKELDTEATALGALALAGTNEAEARKLRQLLYHTQEKDGAWRLRQSLKCSSYATSLAIIALVMDARKDCLTRALHWLLSRSGRESTFRAKLRFRFFDRRVQFNPEFYGWPWTDRTLSWVVPTSFAILAIRLCTFCQRSPEITKRLASALHMLRDRACPQGGWNAGNGVVDGMPSSPRIEPTSLALLALRGIAKSDSFTGKALQWLEQQAPRCVGLSSLSWAILALFTYGRDVNLLKIRLGNLAAISTHLTATEMAEVVLALQAGQVILPVAMPNEAEVLSSR